MKKSVLSITCGLVLMMMGVYGCSSDETAQFHVREFANTGCKSVVATRGDGFHQESVEYKALANGYLQTYIGQDGCGGYNGTECGIRREGGGTLYG